MLTALRLLWSCIRHPRQMWQAMSDGYRIGRNTTKTALRRGKSVSDAWADVQRIIHAKYTEC